MIELLVVGIIALSVAHRYGRHLDESLDPNIRAPRAQLPAARAIHAPEFDRVRGPDSRQLPEYVKQFYCGVYPQSDCDCSYMFKRVYTRPAPTSMPGEPESVSK
jgi:hypothetical protein